MRTYKKLATKITCIVLLMSCLLLTGCMYGFKDPDDWIKYAAESV